ncbi:pilus motility taxis protein HmpF [Acaryochloris marina]|uniref:pilus motility taxis protein HmpF n=1 Tax=Acaryochloris marina TaxID=155978 RepID=UPI001BAE58B2|nr:pilus motility taxis protein HmpF [Acaryochloris marina]
MLYLAEVHKKTGFMGAKTELKLLAQKQSEHNWSPISGEELLQADAANDYNAGVLVLVEMDGNQQLKSIQDATRQLVGILKSFSRMREKFKTQEEEIEGWKQSLIYQSQELTRREVDMEARAEEIQEWDAESQKIEQQRQEFEATRTQILQLKEQMELDRQQLEEGWGRLQNAQNEAQAGLSDEQVRQIEQLLEQLDQSLANGTSNPDHVLASINQHPQIQEAWQTLDQDRSHAQQQQATLDQQQSELQSVWQEWQQTEDSLAQTKLELKVQEQSFTLKEEQKSWLSEQLQVQSNLYENLTQMQGAAGEQADVQRLRDMPLEELETTVEKLNTELVKLSSFVNDQEEELKYQQEAIDELEAKIQNASEYDQLSLTGEVEDERQHFRLLDETLEGQRKTLKEREAILYFHQDILYQRKRSQQNKFHQSATLDLAPIVELAKAEQEKQQQSLERLNHELSDLEASLQVTRNTIETTSTEQDNKRNALKQQEHELENQKTALAELWGKVKTSESLLQPIQDVVESLKGQAGAEGQQDNPAFSTLNELKQVFMAIGQGS